MTRMPICRNVCLLDLFECKQREEKSHVSRVLVSFDGGGKRSMENMVSMGVQHQRLDSSLCFAYCSHIIGNMGFEQYFNINMS
jgi:hypothetical protein